MSVVIIILFSRLVDGSWLGGDLGGPRTCEGLDTVPSIRPVSVMAVTTVRRRVGGVSGAP